MGLLIGFLTFALVAVCLFLILLILVQLPKKEAGIGQAFGGGATDALFGAGSGNVLTKMTKYSATTFLALSLVLSVLHAHKAGSSTKSLDAALRQKAAAPVAISPQAPATASTATTSLLKTTMAPSNAPAAANTPAPVPATPPAK
ncbi:MAG TPA: preprotein translocase subunit SecG [Verrucomicrobiae bacterium]|nr:preprotein translocase subunit SecG [Verrucomicrobiae bacterium]